MACEPTLLATRLTRATGDWRRRDFFALDERLLLRDDDVPRLAVLLLVVPRLLVLRLDVLRLVVLRLRAIGLFLAEERRDFFALALVPRVPLRAPPRPLAVFFAPALLPALADPLRVDPLFLPDFPLEPRPDFRVVAIVFSRVSKCVQQMTLSEM